MNIDATEQYTATSQAPEVLVQLFAHAGIQFNGSHAWDIQVHDNRLYREILTKGSLGFGEAYMKGYWECQHLDDMFYRLLGANLNERIKSVTKLKFIGEVLRHRVFNLQKSSRAYEVALKHYDIGNDLFTKMLDPSMSYSCAYWANAHTLEDAQFHKLEMICRKLELKAGEHLLEIGCGWGGLAYHAAKYYGVKVTGITVSKEQQRYAQTKCKDFPIEILLVDYRELTGQFDKIVSVGMFEHVGQKNYRTYFNHAHACLKDDGLFLLHTIGDYVTSHKTDAWIEKYIFPNGKLPSAKEIARSIERKFVIEDWHNFGQDYDQTLMAWWYRFEQAWPELSQHYDETFYRMWKYYLQSCAGYFRCKQGQLWQIVLSKRERAHIYRSYR
ncbi:MAG TPA: cyclopropane fatty acyl phospholipid synthase [Methylophilaceae bacterium]|nr:cyclopropane fatty acyl phospholipid synthase [Methylophilaceae bacterium]